MYVPDEQVLGNPGLFGFIGKAVKGVVKVAAGALGISGAKVTIPPPQVTVIPAPAPAPMVATTQARPDWIVPAAIGGGALLLVLLMSRRR